MTELAGDGVVNPEKGETINKYENQLKIQSLKPTWTKSMCNELGRLNQGWYDENGTNTIKFMAIHDILAIPKNKTVT